MRNATFAILVAALLLAPAATAQIGGGPISGGGGGGGTASASTLADDIPCAGTQSIRRNAGDTAWECYTPGTGTIGGSTGSTDNAILRADGTGGSTAQGSVVTIADTTGAIRSGSGTNALPTYGFTSYPNTGFGIESTGDARPAVIYGGNIAARFDQAQMTFPSNGIIAWGNQVNTFSSSSDDTYIRRPSAGSIDVWNALNGSRTGIKTATTTVNLSGATSTATGLFPAKCIQLGVSYRVTTAVTGATSFDVGDGSDVDRYGATIAVTLGTTGNLSNATADPRGWSASAGDVVFTANGSNFTGGVVRVVAHYIDLTAPTS